jgi:hypothetical protein
MTADAPAESPRGPKLRLLNARTWALTLSVTAIVVAVVFSQLIGFLSRAH